MRIANRHMLDASELAAVSRLFSSSLFQELARNGKSPLFARLAEQTGLTSVLPSNDTVGNLFDMAFSLLSRGEYRNEYVYKAAIAHKVLLGVHSLKTASMLNEFRVGNCKVDVAILNGTSTAYEIKSERDKLDRLCNQVDAYRKVFARVNIITAEHHVNAVLKEVPSDVGVMRLSNRYQISTERESIDSPERVVPDVIFDTLRLGEARLVLETLNMATPDVPNTRMYMEMKKLFVQLDPVELHYTVVGVLKNTRSQKSIKGLVDSLPKSLQVAALLTPLRKSDHARLKEVVNLPIDEALSWA